MQIHVVEPGDTIESIARKYQISAQDLIIQNNLDPKNQLAIGEALVILFPELTYRVREGDTLESISLNYNIPLLELLRNNPNLLIRPTISLGDVLILRYSQKREICVHGNTFGFINTDFLRSALPYLTYLSIINYTATGTGEIKVTYDDDDIISVAKEYNVIPLMYISTFEIDGSANTESEYSLMLSPLHQSNLVDNIITMLKEKGLLGVNIAAHYVRFDTLPYYEGFLLELSERVREEGFLLFLNLRPEITTIDGETVFEHLNYSFVNELVDYCIFNQYTWPRFETAPGPLLSVYDLNIFLEYATQYIDPCKIMIGIPTVGYSWSLPYSEGSSQRNSISINNALGLEREFKTGIKFDEPSQTPYIEYEMPRNNDTQNYIAWFVDARTITAIFDLVEKYNLCCIDIWNTSTYNPALWSLINSEYKIEKILP